MSKNYVRFMRYMEMYRYLSKETLKNKTDWNMTASRSNSVGFCFFDDSVPPEERMEYLTGVVDMDVVAVFEPVGNVKFREGVGIYRDSSKELSTNLFDLLFEPIPMMEVKEYSLREYSYQTLKLVKFGYPKLEKDSGYSIDWEIWNDRKVIPLRKVQRY